MPSLNGITYSELHDGSGNLSVSDNGTAERRLKCAWSDSINLCNQLYGYVDTNAAGQLVIVQPQSWPENPLLVVTEVSRVPLGKPTAEGQWQNAILTVRYGTRPYNPSDLLEESLDFGGETITIPAAEVTYPGGSHPAEDQQVTIALVDYTITIHRMPKLPTTLINTYLNCVNSATFKGITAGHALFLGASASRKTTIFGAQSWEVAFKFSWSPFYDHRNRYNPKSTSGTLAGKFEALTNNTAPLYQTADFNLMFAVQGNPITLS